MGADPYGTFTAVFIDPIIKALNIRKDQILFIPGNHDINREYIEEDNEYFLANNLTKETANKKVKELAKVFDRNNKRIEGFKAFEKGYHDGKPGYLYSNFESLSIESNNGHKVGVALLNDSWRCSSDLTKEQHYMGYNQLFNAKRHFQEHKTAINIAVFHHPLSAFNSQESEEIENILKTYDFHIALFGHSHRYKYDELISANGGFVALNGRSAFNNANENQANFQPGYNILDLDIDKMIYQLYARKFVKGTGFIFDKDVDSLKDGTHAGSLAEKAPYYKFDKSASNVDKELPDSYEADVKRIVRLLIGKSLYPNPFIFVRELIQNSVDACNRKKEKNTQLDPKITVNINTSENYFEIHDEGDGMSKRALREHFSVIGKSLSQEFNDANGNFNLISQFGIGFISTFIAAQKVTISTKSEEDGLINFEIEDVFKAFNYNVTPTCSSIGSAASGTTIRVYLKSEHRSVSLFEIAKNYCRHINNITFYVNGIKQEFGETWNTENGVYFYKVSGSKWRIEVELSNNFKHIIASNSGFLISYNSPAIIPYKFPFCIGGEVNFAPKSIDFDLSRSNIIESEKSNEFRRELSLSLRPLFRQALEENNNQLVPIVVNYLQFYLVNYDAFQKQFSETYKDFYSKKELVSLCLEHLVFEFDGKLKNLSEILRKLKERGIDTIYITHKSSLNDNESIVVNYLRDRGNFVVKHAQIVNAFHDEQNGMINTSVIKVIAAMQGFKIADVTGGLVYSEIANMKINRKAFPAKLVDVVAMIEREQRIEVHIASFNKTSKPFVTLKNQYFINSDHPTFQSLLANVERLPDAVIKVYLLGVFGIGIESGRS